MKKERKIELITFLSSINENDYEREVCIFYDDYTLEYKTYEEGKEELAKLMEEEKLTIKDLENYNKVKFSTKEDFIENYYSEINIRDAMTSLKKDHETGIDENKEIEKLFNRKNKKSKKKRSKKRLQRFLTISILSVCAACIGGSIAVYNKLFKDNTLEDSSDNDLKNTNGKLTNTNKVLSLLNDYRINKEKKKFANTTYNYLYNYNKTFADKYAEKNTNARAAHRWDEVVSQQLIFNSYNKKQLGDIFDYYDFDSNIMYNAYVESLKQETMAHVIQTEPINKTNILNEKANKFYKKYEKLNTKFNIQTDNNEKKKIATAFFKELRSDIDFENTSTIAGYKTSILPIVDAMMIKCENVKIKGMLNKKEENWFYNTCLEIANNKLKNNDQKLESVSAINKSVGEVFDITFEDIEDAAMETLESEKLYNTSNLERDLRVYNSYNNAILVSKTKSKNSHSMYEHKDNTTYTYTYTDTDNNNETKEEDNNQDKENKSKDSKEKKKKSIKSTKSRKNNNIDSKDSSDNNSDYDIDSDSDNYDYDSEDSYEDNDEYEDSENNEEENTDNKNYADMPNDNEVKDITDDPTGAVDHSEPLPDPNSYDTNSLSSQEYKEKVADKIIEKMANEDTVTIQKSVQYIK